MNIMSNLNIGDGVQVLVQKSTVVSSDSSVLFFLLICSIIVFITIFLHSYYTQKNEVKKNEI
jgi:hypothetical protein